jgi:chromosome segregation ATPase
MEEKKVKSIIKRLIHNYKTENKNLHGLLNKANDTIQEIGNNLQQNHKDRMDNLRDVAASNGQEIEKEWIIQVRKRDMEIKELKDQLTQKTTESTNNTNKIQCSLEKLERELDASQKKVILLQNELDHSRKVHAEQLVNLDQKIAQGSHELHQANQQKSEYIEKITKLLKSPTDKHQIEATQQLIQNLKSEIELKNSKLETLSSTTNKLNEQVESERSRAAAQIEQEIMSYKKKIETMMEENEKKMGSLLKSHLEEIQRKDAIISRLERMRESSLLEYEKMQQNINILMKESHLLKQENEEIQQQLDIARSPMSPINSEASEVSSSPWILDKSYNNYSVDKYKNEGSIIPASITQDSNTISPTTVSLILPEVDNIEFSIIDSFIYGILKYQTNQVYRISKST